MSEREEEERRGEAGGGDDDSDDGDAGGGSAAWRGRAVVRTSGWWDHLSRTDGKEGASRTTAAAPAGHLCGSLQSAQSSQGSTFTPPPFPPPLYPSRLSSIARSQLDMQHRPVAGPIFS